MGQSSLSTAARSFIDNHIRSVEDLEILLLLRAEPLRRWDASDVSRQLGLEPIGASGHLLSLSEQGLVAHQKSAGLLFDYRYLSGSELFEQKLAELAEVFSKARFEVVEYILSNQRRQMRAFAAAFKVRPPTQKDG